MSASFGGFFSRILTDYFRRSVGTQTTIGLSPPDSALLYVILSPVGPYYKTGFKPVALHGTTAHVRAYPGGRFKIRRHASAG